MKFILAVLLIAVLSFLAGIFLPWWSIAIISFLVALMLDQKISLGFLSGFLAIFLLWGCVSFWIDMKNDHILATKMSEVFHLGNSPILIVLITAIVGGLVAGFASMSGSSIRPVKRRRY